MAEQPVKPIFVIVPGFWETNSGAFTQVARTLQLQHGYSTTIAALPSTGQSGPGNPTLQDDIAAVHFLVQTIVNKGNHVVLVGHSAGGYIACASTQGLTRKERQANKQPGGVCAFAFVCAGIYPKGASTGAMPFFDIQGSKLFCASPRELLFNDITNDAEAEQWVSCLQHQPANDWDGMIEYVGYDDAPCFYLICENDAVVPVSMQEGIAASCNAQITRCNAGHMAFITQASTVVDFLLKVVTQVDSL